MSSSKLLGQKFKPYNVAGDNKKRREKGKEMQKGGEKVPMSGLNTQPPFSAAHVTTYTIIVLRLCILVACTIYHNSHDLTVAAYYRFYVTGS